MTKMPEDLLRMLEDIVIGPLKEELKESMIEAMDTSARFLVGTLRLGEELNIFDSETYAAILNQLAEKHYDATRGMSPDEISEYMKDIGEADNNGNISRR